MLHPYGPLAWRAWTPMDNVTMYDPWYAALAEAVEVSPARFDRRLAGALGTTCDLLLRRRESGRIEPRSCLADR